MAKFFVLLSALLSLGAASPITVPSQSDNFHHSQQLLVPIFRQQIEHFLQQRLADRSDPHHNHQKRQHQLQHFESDYSNTYEATNSINPEAEASSQEQQQQQGSHQFINQQHQPHDYSAFTNFHSENQQNQDQQDLDVGGNNEAELGDFGGRHGLLANRPHYVQSEPVSKHVQVSNPVVVPVYKKIGVPVFHPVRIPVFRPVTVGVPQPYPILVPMIHPVPYEVIKTIVKTVEKKVPTPIEKIIPVASEKPVPFEVIKHVPMFYEQKIPIKIPVYKTIHHKIIDSRK
ncbi:homeotic protein proboscipedia-like [Copidosoma floridanum]|uniref:homeotic protein proboscipedia-like n=1 Tax=Copidosoma floridanum TaxID=29053 RepID=UPI000C6F792E|nr:homeotic protein proboscipedia-like [Copidosoma floridanum]